MSWWERHVLPRLVDRCCSTAEMEKLRGPVCEGLYGEIVELGFGSGLNVAHYPPRVSAVAAVEPSDLAWRLAAPRVAAAPARIRRAGLDGQRLELADASCDAAVSTFTLCTIPDAGRALAELRRVLKPGAELHFVEHGLAPDPGVVRWQRRFEPVQRRVAGGCHLTRPIAELLEGSGFRIAALENFYAAGPRPFGFLYLGRAAVS